MPAAAAPAVLEALPLGFLAAGFAAASSVLSAAASSTIAAVLKSACFFALPLGFLTAASGSLLTFSAASSTSSGLLEAPREPGALSAAAAVPFLPLAVASFLVPRPVAALAPAFAAPLPFFAAGVGPSASASSSEAAAQ